MNLGSSHQACWGHFFHFLISYITNGNQCILKPGALHEISEELVADKNIWFSIKFQYLVLNQISNFHHLSQTILK